MTTPHRGLPSEPSSTAPVTDPIKVLLADDHRLVLEGLRSCLEVYDHIEIVATATDGESALSLAAEMMPDVVLLDINMPGINGLETARKLARLQPDAKILIVSMHDNPEYVSSALSLGAKGYILKHVSTREMVAAIEAVQDGGTYLSAGASAGLVSGEPACAATQSRVKLSARERLVLVLLSEGRSNKEVAAELSISVRTVETHRKNLKRKLAISTTAGLTRYVIEHGLTREQVA